MSLFISRAERLRQEGRALEHEIANRTTASITAALSLVVGLAWNDAIKALIEYIFPLKADSIWIKFLYAILLTVVVVIISVYLVRLFKKEESPNP